MQSPEMADYARNGTVVHRIGYADRLFAPHGVYRCRPDDDGTERFVAIAVRTDEQWQQLATLMGRADLAADPELAARLALPGYKALPERAMLFHLSSFDWNCAQHITPRFTAADIEPVVSELQARIAELEAESRALRGA